MSRSPLSCALLLGLALASSSCAEPGGEAEATTWPDGTAVALGPIPISRAELEEVADALAVVNPINTRRSLRREALIAQLLPRAAARLDAGDEAERSRALAEVGLAVLRDERDGAPPQVFARSGFATDLGFDLWSRARLLEPGSWYGPFEGIGNWFVLRAVDEPGDGVADLETRQYHLEWAAWTFVPPKWGAAESEELCRRYGVQAIQPELADLIPFTYRRPNGS